MVFKIDCRNRNCEINKTGTYVGKQITTLAGIRKKMYIEKAE